MNGIPFELPGFRITAVENRYDCLTISAKVTTVGAACPQCHEVSTHLHSHYTRSPRDLPTSGKLVRLVLHVRRFRCLNAGCSQVTFSERLPQVVAPSAQRTVRLSSSLSELGLALGGEAGARQSRRLGMAASPSTVLRFIRRCAFAAAPTPRILGIDDFALRKGQVYGTLLVDDETHRPVDVVPDRTAETVATWLQAHPGVQMITRDRSTEYARGVSQGAPGVLEIADRWHLLVNLREALERLLDQLRPSLFSAQRTQTSVAVGQPFLMIYDRERRRGTKDQIIQQASRARRYARYAQVKALQAQGYKILQIARELNLSRQTVRKYLASDRFPDHARPERQPSRLDAYVAYLQERWNAGCHDSQQLWRELRDRGFTGSSRSVWQWTVLRRERLLGGSSGRGRPPARAVQVFTPPESAAMTRSPWTTLPASRRLVWLLLRPQAKLNQTEQQRRDWLLQFPELERAYTLAQQFLTMVRQRRPADFDPWVDACRASGLSELANFASGLQREGPMILAALEVPYSNGVTEGHVNRLKTIKRTMYGRANFDLLRLRVLAAA